MRSAIAVIAAGVAHWIFGAGWFTALGSLWIVGTRIPDAEAAAMRAHPSPAPYVLTLIMDLLMAAALLWIMHRMGEVSIPGGVKIGAITGLCLVGAAMVTEFAFEAKPLSFYFITAGYPILGMVLMGLITGAIAQRKPQTLTATA